MKMQRKLTQIALATSLALGAAGAQATLMLFQVQQFDLSQTVANGATIVGSAASMNFNTFDSGLGTLKSITWSIVGFDTTVDLTYGGGIDGASPPPYAYGFGAGSVTAGALPVTYSAKFDVTATANSPANNPTGAVSISATLQARGYTNGLYGTGDAGLGIDPPTAGAAKFLTDTSTSDSNGCDNSTAPFIGLDHCTVTVNTGTQTWGGSPIIETNVDNLYGTVDNIYGIVYPGGAFSFPQDAFIASILALSGQDGTEQCGNTAGTQSVSCSGTLKFKGALLLEMDYETNAAPEPASMALLGGGLALLGLSRRRLAVSKTTRA